MRTETLILIRDRLQILLLILSEFKPCPNPGWREKININFIFALLRDASKCFMKALKAFIKLFVAPPSVKIKIWFNFYFNINFLNAQDGKG